jgi:hypothetical protein
LSIAAALAAHGVDHRDVAVDWAGQIGCPVVAVARIRDIGTNTDLDDEADCRRAADLWPEHIRLFKPDLVLVVTSYMEAANLTRTLGGPWEHVGQPDFDAYLAAQYDADVHVAASGGARVAWATAPRADAVDWSVAQELRQRLSRLNDIFSALAARHPKLTMIPLAALVDRPDGTIDWNARPDGVHFTMPAARAMVDSWLAHMLLEAVNQPPKTPEPVVAKR